ncbi:MAG: hypothetical protein EOP56_10115 [Sphingobacteriales bacterium]|nr:MAG: hypothetical protein EOP56_10115 [Sphingobacteriales bacterium]
MKIAPARYSFFLIALSLVTLFGCGKDPEPLKPIGGGQNPGGTLEYSVIGVKDISMERVGEATMQVNVERVSGDKNTEIQLLVADLPPGMKAYIDVQKSAPSFISFVTISSERVLEGSYKLSLVSSAKNAVKSVPFVVKVLPYTNHSQGVKGEYIETHKCSADGEKTVTVTIIPDQSIENKVIMRGFWSGTQINEVVAFIEPASHTITIPEQTLYDVTYKGSGTYTDDQITVNYSAKTQIFDETCTAVLNRKK